MKNNRGGLRKGAGRKPLPSSEKKSILKLYLKNSVINKLGGCEKLQEKLIKQVVIWNDDQQSDTIQ